MDLLRSIIRMRRPSNYQPDFNRFRRAITTLEPGPVPFGDLFADYDTVGKYLNEKIFDYDAVADPDFKINPSFVLGALKSVDQSIRFCLGNEWDYCYCSSTIPFPGMAYQETESISNEETGGKRYYLRDDIGPIQTWQDFETYPWPQDVQGVNILARAMALRVPDGMKVMVTPGGLFEWTCWLMGLIPFSYALADNPELVDAVIAKVSHLILAVIENIILDPNIGGIFLGDDMGFATGTLVSPAVLRKKFLPHLKQAVDLVHQAGKVFVLHSCGNIYEVMEDLIATGIDAKNSFEDKIMPVEQVYERWGDQVALVGGVDIHLLTVGEESDIRKRVREILDVCGPKGHYVLGTGNSVANYIPIKNYLAMLDEGRQWNKEHFGQEH